MLTPYQIEIFKRLAEGITVKEISERFNKKEKAVNSSVWRAKIKIGAANNVHAVYLLTKQGVL